jgi:hypothetical protein
VQSRITSPTSLSCISMIRNLNGTLCCIYYLITAAPHQA